MSEEIRRKIKLYKNKIEKDPKNYKHQLRLGKVYLSVKKYKQALLHLIWAQKLANNFETNYFLARAYFAKEKFSKGIKFARQAHHIKPKSRRGKELYQKFKTEISHHQHTRDALANKIADEFFNYSIEDQQNKPATKRGNVKKELVKDPYNYCDGFCKKCDYREACRVYKERVAFEEKCQAEGKDPEDVEVIINEIEGMLDSIKDDLGAKSQVMGVELRKVDENDLSQEKKMQKKILTSKMFRKIVKFSNASLNFIEKLFEIIDEDPMVGALFNNEIEKVIHYSRICEPKTYRAMTSLVNKNEDQQDALKTLAIVLESLNICQSSIGLINELGESRWTAESLIMLTYLKDAKDYIMKNYTKAKKYRKIIIINSNYENKFSV